MKGLCFLLLFVHIQAKYLVEYTHLVLKAGVMYAVICDPESSPDCGNVYEPTTSFKLFVNSTEAVEFINEGGLCDRIKDFQFVALYQLTPIKIEEKVIGEETYFETTQVEKTRNRTAWVIQE